MNYLTEVKKYFLAIVFCILFSSYLHGQQTLLVKGVIKKVDVDNNVIFVELFGPERAKGVWQIYSPLRTPFVINGVKNKFGTFKVEKAWLDHEVELSVYKDGKVAKVTKVNIKIRQ